VGEAILRIAARKELPNQSRIIAEFKGEDGELSEQRVRDLLKRGEGKYWEVKRGANNAKFFTVLPGLFGLTHIKYVSNRQTGLTVFTNNSLHYGKVHPQTSINTGFDGLTGGVVEPEKPDFSGRIQEVGNFRFDQTENGPLPDFEF
jgi:hypothetical protein